MAWHQLTDITSKSEIKLDSDDTIVTKLLDNINTCAFKGTDFSESDYYIKSGYVSKKEKE